MSVFRQGLKSFSAVMMSAVMLALVLAIMLALARPGRLMAASDRIVAVVNSDIITMRQLENRVDGMAKSKSLTGAAREDLRRQVLGALIEQELVSQQAKSRGITVSEVDVNKAIEMMRQEDKLTDAGLRASLAKNGLSYEAFRDDIRFEILKNRVLGLVVMSKVVVTENEVTAFLKGEGPKAAGGLGPLSGLGGSPNDHMGVRIIALPYDAKSKTPALNEAGRIKGEIEGGAVTFAEAAGLYSRGPGRDQGGDPGQGLTVGQMPPELRQAAAKIAPGQVSEPVDMGNAYLLLAVVEGGGAKAAEPVKPSGGDGSFTPEQRQAARDQLRNIKMQQRYMDWLAELKSKAIIKITL